LRNDGLAEYTLRFVRNAIKHAFYNFIVRLELLAGVYADKDMK
jgi:hypothetical protein